MWNWCSARLCALFPIGDGGRWSDRRDRIAVLMKTRNARLKKVIKGALPVGLLGIGELIFGVTLPLGKPFIGALTLGGAVGGALISYWKWRR